MRILTGAVDWLMRGLPFLFLADLFSSLPPRGTSGGGSGRAARQDMGYTPGQDMGYTLRIGEAIALSENTFIEPLREAAFVLP